MNRSHAKTVALALIVVALAAPAQAGEQNAVKPTEHPFLWVVSADPPSFLYGTIHLPDDRVLALPAVVNTAFDASDVVCTEIPLDMETQMKAAAAFMLPGEETLTDILPEDLYKRTDAFLQARGLSLGMLQKFKVYAIAIQLMLLDYLPDLATKKPLDATLYERAIAEGKVTDGLETVDEQIAVFDALTTDDQIELLDDTLDYMEKAQESGKPVTERIVDAYLQGDGKALWDTMHEYMDPDKDVYKKFMKLALSDRNRRLADRIVQRLKENPGKSYFFAIGAGHFDRDDGILALLEKSGYEVTRLHAADAERLDRQLGVLAE